MAWVCCVFRFVHTPSKRRLAAVFMIRWMTRWATSRVTTRWVGLLAASLVASTVCCRNSTSKGAPQSLVCSSGPVDVLPFFDDHGSGNQSSGWHLRTLSSQQRVQSGDSWVLSHFFRHRPKQQQAPQVRWRLQGKASLASGSATVLCKDMIALSVMRAEQVVMIPKTDDKQLSLQLQLNGGWKTVLNTMVVAKRRRPLYRVRKVATPPVVDGKIEPVWMMAETSSLFRQAVGGPAVADSAVARLLWDDTFLYGVVEAPDSFVHSPVVERDGALWKHDVVEMFVDADKSGSGYAEVQVNPNNTILDYWFVTRRGGKVVKSWSADIDSAVSQANQVGPLGKPGWIVEFAMPLAKLRSLHVNDAIDPPALGERWRFNIVRIDNPAKSPLAAEGWSTIRYSDFHSVGNLMEIEFRP